MHQPEMQFLFPAWRFPEIQTGFLKPHQMPNAGKLLLVDPLANKLIRESHNDLTSFTLAGERMEWIVMKETFWRK